MKKLIYKIFTCALLILSIVTINILNVNASNPFITRTLDRYGELVETQDAYESIIKYKSFSNDEAEYTLSSPQDIYCDVDDYIYIADTGNKRIVILDEAYNYVTCFGSDNLYKPTGIFVRDNVIYVADYGLGNDNTTGKISLYSFDKDTKEVTFIENRLTPDSNVLAIDSFIYRPTKISVDTNLTMYVVSEGSYNGILTISNENRFMSFFSPNEVETSFWDKITRFLYGENEQVILKDNLPTPPYNVHIDDSGYIYTVTQCIVKNQIGDSLKKVNIGGVNFYSSNMVTAEDFVACWSGKYGNVYGATKDGFIYEYDLEGNILFIFSGKSTSIDQLGLFDAVSSITVRSNDDLIILDSNDSSFQIFKPTNYANTVHTALGLYNEGKYTESKELWEEVLVYNSMTDIAHKGIGLAYYLQGDYEKALVEFKLANDKKDYSEAFWEIRNVWLQDNIGTIFIILVSLAIVVITLSILNKKLNIFKKVKEFFNKIKEKKHINNFLSLTRSLKHPLDTTYNLKTIKSISILNGVIYLAILFILYILGITCTGFIFNEVVIEKTILLKEALKVIIPIVLFVFANYLASSLLDGEGSFRAIVLTSLSALMPIIVMYPIAIIVSNIITLNESFIYYFILVIMIGWSAVNLFVMNKELHNYNGKKMFLNIIMTIVLMFVLLIVVILVYLMFAQVVEFVKDIISEVIFHD